MLSRRLAGENAADYGVEPLGLLDCTVIRNGYGRQIDSFTAPVDLATLDGSQDPFPAVFIRAPRITAVGKEVEVLARHQEEPVIVRQGRLLGMAFHPELTDDLRIHRSFLELLAG
jgi:5'-phosphate synthase pdxT subunit